MAGERLAQSAILNECSRDDPPWTAPFLSSLIHEPFSIRDGRVAR